MPSSTITRKGQLTMPKVIRDRLGVQEGDRVAFRITGDGEVVVEAATVDFRDLRGALRSERRVSIEEMNEAIRTAGTRR